MPRIEAQQLSKYKSDIALQRAVQQYKSYCSIRRDLRKSDEICNYIIGLHDSIKKNVIQLDQVAGTLFLVRASAMHAILLYTRWFKGTNGKPMLNNGTFFSAGSSLRAVHDKLIDHRDKYIAHNELDLLGADRIWVETDSSGRFVKSESDWVEQMWLQDNELNMKSFQDCIHTVHNKIDAEILPGCQSKLDRRLQVLLGNSIQQQ